MKEYLLLLLVVIMLFKCIQLLGKLWNYLYYGQWETRIKYKKNDGAVVYIKPQDSVQWFDFLTLYKSYQKISKTTETLSIIDKREIEAGFPVQKITEHWKDDSEVWFDFLADTGDGFNSTASVFHTITRDKLELHDALGTKHEMLRPRFVIIGGDLVYPNASEEEYNNRFKGPIRIVSKSDNENPIYLFATPGNHDWYDGLTSFFRLMCQQKYIGAFKTEQTRSYFAFQIKYGLHILCLDNQLLGDIDIPQIEYFKDYIKKCIESKLSLIVCVAEPYWYNYNHDDKGKYRQRMDSMIYFLSEMCKLHTNIEYKLILTGDIHHYSKYQLGEDKNIESCLITSGGGGAFKHLTHKLKSDNDIITQNPKDPNKIISYKFKKNYYADKISEKNLLKNILFPIYNYKFLILQYFIVLFFYSLNNQFQHNWFTVLLSYTILPAIYYFIFRAVENKNEHSPISFFKKFYLPIAMLSICIITLNYFLTKISFLQHTPTYSYQLVHLSWVFNLSNFLIPFLFVFLGSIIIGLYLILQYQCNGGQNINEASSSIVESGYNNFLRFKITANKIEIFTIGINKAYNWYDRLKKQIKETKNDEVDFCEIPIDIKRDEIHIVDYTEINY